MLKNRTPIPRSFAQVAEVIALLIILSLASYLRLANINENPGWYSDEGTIINIAYNFQHGRVQYLALTQSTLLAARLPLFPMLLAGIFQLFGDDINTLRVFSGTLGVITVGLLFGVVRHILSPNGAPLALLAALMSAIYPNMVIYNRIGFSYHLLTPLVLVTLLGLWEYLSKSKPIWLALAALAIGVGSTSDLMILTLVPSFILVVSVRKKYDLIWSLPILALPFTIYCFAMLLTVPEAFSFDFKFTLSRLGTIPPIAQFPAAAFNLGSLMSWDPWLTLGIIGLFLLRPIRFQRLALLLLVLPILSLGRTTSGLASLGFYYLVPLLPLAALGIASLIWNGTPLVLKTVESSFLSLLQHWGWTPSQRLGRWIRMRVIVLLNSIALFLIVITPFLVSALHTINFVEFGFVTSIDWVLVDAANARQVADFVNQHTQPDDLVIGSPAIAWLFDSHSADFQQAIAAKGFATIHFPANMPENRFAYDSRPSQAKYVVVDRIWHNWAGNVMPEVSDLMYRLETWPLEFQLGEYYVYRNPEIAK